MPPRRWTALFFLDEAVAMAAGHRPCGQCRHTDYQAFTQAWTTAMGTWPGPKEADAILHAGRAHPGARDLRQHLCEAHTLPDGTFCLLNSTPHLIWGDQALRYGPDGYGPALPRPRGPVTTLTSPVMQRVLAAGYAPRLHPTARALLCSTATAEPGPKGPDQGAS